MMNTTNTNNTIAMDTINVTTNSGKLVNSIKLVAYATGQVALFIGKCFKGLFTSARDAYAEISITQYNIINGEVVRDGILTRIWNWIKAFFANVGSMIKANTSELRTTVSTKKDALFGTACTEDEEDDEEESVIDVEAVKAGLDALFKKGEAGAEKNAKRIAEAYEPSFLGGLDEQEIDPLIKNSSTTTLKGLLASARKGLAIYEQQGNKTLAKQSRDYIAQAEAELASRK